MFKRYAVASCIELVTPANFKATADNMKKVMPQAGPNSVASFDYDPENFVYFRCRAISADTPNGNGDMFPADELRKAYKSFIGVGLYKDHDSGSVDKSVGKVLWADWIPDGKYVECYCAVDRKLSPELARRVEMGEASTVSMGCMVGEAICGVEGCGNVAHNQMELCEHMMPGTGIKGKRLADGKVAYEINKLLQFTELSLVTVPADPTARIFEVFAAMREGKMSESDMRKAVRDELASLAGAIAADIIIKTNEKNAASSAAKSSMTAASTTAPPEKDAPGVAKVDDSTEDKMNLSISYLKGPSLESSFFLAKEANAEFKVSAAEVIPLIVQEAIRTKQPGVATPDQVVADLSTKCSTLSEFKKWAKKRKKKNMKAMEKMAPKAEDGKEKEAAPVAEAPAAPAAEVAPEASTEVLNPAPVSDAPAADAGTPEPSVVTETPEGLTPAEPTADELKQAIEQLTRMLESKTQSSAKAPQKTATVTQKEVKDRHEAGETVNEHGSYSPAKDPAATSEVISASEPAEHRDEGKETGDRKYSPASAPMKPGAQKSEEPKGHMDAGQVSKDQMFGYSPAKVKGSEETSMKKEAAEKDATWSVNPKELESKPAPSKPAQAAPAVVSWDGKEMSSEQIKLGKGGTPGSQVKKFYNRLPSGGLGEAPKSMDLKSAKDPEKDMLRQALEKAQAEKKALEEKQALQAVADKIYEVVKALREKNILAEASEDDVIGILGSSFKESSQLDAVLNLVSKLSAAAEAAQPEAEAGEVGQGVPQVFETVTQTEDAIATMAKIWNL